MRKKRVIAANHPFRTGSFTRPVPWNKKPLLSFTCKNCGVIFQTNIKKNANKFCSQNCYWISLKGKPIQEGKNHWNYSGHPISRKGTRFNYSQMNAIARSACYRCQSCSKKLPEGVLYKTRMHLSFDHIIPIKLGGEHSITNGQLLCRACNASKTKRDRMLIFHITRHK